MGQRRGKGVNLTGYIDSLYMLSYILSIHSKAVKEIIKEIIRQKDKICYFYDPSLTHKGGSGGKSDRLYRLSTYGS